MPNRLRPLPAEPAATGLRLSPINTCRCFIPSTACSAGSSRPAQAIAIAAVPCEEHRIALKDPAGRAHPVMADVGCRNTVFGAEAQQASSHLEAWRGVGIRHFRLEFVHESADQVLSVGEAFAATIAGGMPALDLA